MLDMTRTTLNAVKSELRPEQPTRVLRVHGLDLGLDDLAAAVDLYSNCGLVGVHLVLIDFVAY